MAKLRFGRQICNVHYDYIHMYTSEQKSCLTMHIFLLFDPAERQWVPARINCSGSIAIHAVNDCTPQMRQLDRSNFFADFLNEDSQFFARAKVLPHIFKSMNLYYLQFAFDTNFSTPSTQPLVTRGITLICYHSGATTRHWVDEILENRSRDRGPNCTNFVH